MTLSGLIYPIVFTMPDKISTRRGLYVCESHLLLYLTVDDWDGQPFKPKLFTYGNDGGGECGVPYNSRFHMVRSCGLAATCGCACRVLRSTPPSLYTRPEHETRARNQS